MTSQPRQSESAGSARSRVFVRDVEPDPGYEFRVFDPGEEVAIEPGTWVELVPASELEGAVEALEQIRDGDIASTDGIGTPFGRAVRERAIDAIADTYGERFNDGPM